MYFTSGSDRAFESLMQGKPGFDHYDSGDVGAPEDCGDCRFYRPDWKYQFCVYAECPYQPGKLTALDAVLFQVKGVDDEMAVFRVEKNRGYTVMSNHHLRNKDLSLKAKGLLSQMLSLPENWDYTLKGLFPINRESIDAIRTAVWELEKAGYITRQQNRDGKGCKGIGRFLWLKAFNKIEIKSVYIEDGKWYQREFTFSLENTIEPEENRKGISAPEDGSRLTEIRLLGFQPYYRDEVALSLESLVKKVIEHCLPYFIVEGCPSIIVKDNLGDSFSLNSYYKDLYKDTLHRDDITIKGKSFSLYHMTVSEGADKHELHLCANNREVKSYDLAKYIPNLDKKITTDEQSFYYVGYMAGDYLDESVNADRYEFNFSDAPMLDSIGEKDLTGAAVEYITAYLSDDLGRIKDEKQKRIDDFVRNKKPQYRYLLNHRDGIYDKIPVGLTDDKLDLELYKQEQEWEFDIAKQRSEIEEKKKNNATDTPQFMELFKEYCTSVTQLSQASLAEYIVRRKAVIELLEKALEITDDGKYNKESQVHSIICPMQITSDDVQFDEMNLWLIDDRLAYHHFLASDQPMKSLPILESDVPRRMDIAVFDRAISYSADTEDINSIRLI